MSDKLSIAQALRRIKKLKGQIAEDTQRATLGVSYDVKKVPAFRFEEAMVSMRAAQTEMLDLEARVAIANATAKVKDGSNEVVMAYAVRTLQELKGQIAFLKGLHLRAEVVRDKETEWNDHESKHVTTYTETTYVSDLSEQERDKRVKALQNQFESLNNVVETANHLVMV